MKEIKELQDLVGEELTEVRFVMDYIQLAFSSAIISCFSKPKIETGGISYEIPGPGSRDALCLFIGCKLASAIIQERLALTLDFDPEVLSFRWIWRVVDSVMRRSLCRGMAKPSKNSDSDL
jgi:hypothetical protein